MPISSSSEPALPAAWSDVLDRIQHVLAEVLQAADERARAQEGASGENATLPRSVSEGNLLDEPTDASADGDKLAGETEQALAAAQEALDRWLKKAAQVRQRLAELAARAI